MRIIAPLFTRLLSALLALALVAAGVILLTEIVAAWLGVGWTILPDDTAAKLQTWHWDSRPVVTTIIIVGLIGLAALVVGLWRQAPLIVPIGDGHEVTFERHALEGSIRRQIQHIDGVTKARIRSTKDKVRVRVDTNRTSQPQLVRGEVEARVNETLQAQHLTLAPEVQVRNPEGEQ
jgi:hypothetical protein